MKFILSYIALVCLVLSTFVSLNTGSYAQNSLQIDNGFNVLFLSEPSVSENEDTESDGLLAEYFNQNIQYINDDLNVSPTPLKASVFNQYAIRAPPIPLSL